MASATAHYQTRVSPRRAAKAPAHAPATQKFSSAPADQYYGHEDTAKMCARFITHLFSCPDVPPATSQSAVTPSLAHFVAYALHRTRLHSSVTFCALYLLSRLKNRFPAARGSCTSHVAAMSYGPTHLPPDVLADSRPRFNSYPTVIDAQHAPAPKQYSSYHYAPAAPANTPTKSHPSSSYPYRQASNPSHSQFPSAPQAPSSRAPPSRTASLPRPTRTAQGPVSRPSQSQRPSANAYYAAKQEEQYASARQQQTQQYSDAAAAPRPP
ncbi:hypothetical protein FS749_009072 [Ceratobasidium sp. UAMH 11750]|nr:hypothetical protein FS749_009072 [Ceratobasidium sp. UAMH 11750]